MRLAALTNLALALGWQAFGGSICAQTATDEPKIRALIAQWYQRVGDPEAMAPHALLAPGAIDGGPGYAQIPYQRPDQRSAAAYSGPRINYELAGRAMQFAYDIDALVVNANLAKAKVWERGYFFAPAAQKTYEQAADAIFVLERQPDGDWKILAHEASSQGIPPNKITNPMPDLRSAYYAACGAACDPEADAKKAKAW
jgi:hypothetical protein